MKIQRRSALLGASVVFALLPAVTAVAAPPVDGSSKVLKIDGKANLGTQNILVIPVVDSTYPYNPAARQMETAFPGKRQGIVDDYARMASYWNETSYGIVSLSATVSNCFYQIPQEFPNSGEDPYVEAKILGVPTFLYLAKYNKIVVDYTADPAAPPVSKTFVSDPNVTFDSIDALLEQLNAQIGPTDGIEALFEGTKSSFYGRVGFRIKAEDSVPGSSLAVNFTDSDPASRRTLGLVRPTVTSNPATGRVIVRTERASLPGELLSGTGSSLAFNFSNAANESGSFDWAITRNDGTPNDRDCIRFTNCPRWENATQLSTVLRPTAGKVGLIRDTTVNGFPELEYEVQLAQDGRNYTEVRPSPEPLGLQFGIDSIKSQVGKGFGRAKTDQSSVVLTSLALQSLLTAELSSDSGCLATELANLSAPDGKTKAALDAYFDSFDGIHTMLMTDTNMALRANASLDPTTLDANVTIGSSTFPYQLRADITAVNLVSGAPTITHETGHNIGFPDLYDVSTTYPDFKTNFHPNLTWMGNWDLMANQTNFPHTGAFDKQTFHGWISGENGAVITIAPGTDETFVVTPLEVRHADYDVNLPTGPGGERVAKMLILPFGDDVPAPGALVPSHFIAIENRQESLSTDPKAFNLSLPHGGGIHVTDNMSDLRLQGADFKPINRQYSHTLVASSAGFYPDTDGEPVGIGDTLDTTQTFPAYPGISITAIGTVASPNPSLPPSTLVRVAYTTTERLDLKIEPWNAPKEYATRSIWFERATSATPPENPSLPDATGNVGVPLYRDGYDPMANGGTPLNWIHVYVENPGTFAAEDVKLKLWFNSPGGIGDPEYWRELDVTEGKPIPAGGHVVFSVPWSPGNDVGTNNHTCIAVEVHSWKVGAFGQVADVNPFNNLAQENVHKMEMKTGSPWHDVPFSVEVHNSFVKPVSVKLEPKGLLPGYSVKLDQSSVVLGGKSSKVFTGSLHWDPNVIPMPTTQNPYDPYWQACNVAATGGINPPSYCGSTWSLTAYADLGDAQVPLGGVSFETEGKPTATLTSSATNAANGDVLVTGQVLPPYRGQVVRVVVKYPSGKQDTVDVLTLSGGAFVLPFTPQERGPLVITTELPRGTWPYAPTEPTEINLEACVPASSPPSNPPQVTCNDGLKNGSETGVDCGGLSCPPCGGSGIASNLLIESDWGTGYCAVVKVRNLTTKPTTNWNVALNTLQSRIYTHWNANFSANSGNVGVTSLNWNNVIAPGGAVTSTGFCADRLNGSNSTAQVVSAGATF